MENNTLVKVFEATSDIYMHDGKWAFDGRVMELNKDDYETKRFTFSSEEDAKDFLSIVSDIEGSIQGYMQELATELFQIQQMLEEGEPYILLESVDEEDVVESNAVPRLVH